MPKAPARTVYQCVQPFAVWRNGVPEVFGADRMVLADDPILRTHAAHFVEAASRIESATQRPGEKRMVQIPTGSQAESWTPEQPDIDDEEPTDAP